MAEAEEKLLRIDMTLTAEEVAQHPGLKNVPVVSYDPKADRRRSVVVGDLAFDTDTKQYEDHTFIDWQYEYEVYDSQRRKFKNAASKLTRFRNVAAKWTALISASVSAALTALLIDYFSGLLHDFKFGICMENFYLLRTTCAEGWIDWGGTLFNNFILKFILDIIILLCLAAILSWIAFRIANHYKVVPGSGIPQLKMLMAGEYLVDLLDIQMIMGKIVSLLFTVASGLWLGYEGPMVHIASSFVDFNLSLVSSFGMCIHNEALRREMVSTGFAVGIALYFDAPIGGVLFGLEQIETFFQIDKVMWNSFICTTIGVTFLQKMHPSIENTVNESFKVDFKNNWLYFEAIIYVLLGTFCGLMAIVFNKLTIKCARFRRSRIEQRDLKKQMLEVVLVALITNGLSYLLPLTQYSLVEMVKMLFTDCVDDPSSPLCPATSTGFPWQSLLTLAVITIEGFLLSAYTYGISLPGGILVPALTIGALMGRFLGVFMEFMQEELQLWPVFRQCYTEKSSCITAASYAVVGAASFFAGVTKMSVASVVIVSELTGALNYLIPIMMGVFCAKFLNEIVLNKSIYELLMIESDEDYLPSNLEDDMTISELSSMTPSQLMLAKTEMVVLYDDRTMTLGELEDVPESPYGHPILRSTADPQLVGYVTSYQISQELTRIGNDHGGTSDDFVKFVGEAPGCHSLQSIVTPVEDLFVVNSGFSLLSAYEAMDRLKLENIYVCHATGNEFRGVIRRGDMAQLVQSCDQKLHREMYI